MAPAKHKVRVKIDAIRVQIQENLNTSVSGRHFLPIDKFQEIFTLAAIEEAVKELGCEPEDRYNLANTIDQDGKALFAILIDTEKEDLIITFRQHEVLDKQLPLDKEQAQKIAGSVTGPRLVSNQWKFLPYVFPDRMWWCRRHIADAMILPYVSCKQIGLGASGVVEKIGIPGCQQNFVDEAVSALNH